MESESDPWSTTNKVKCKQCGQYNQIENSICCHAENGDIDHFADFYVCQVCGHRGCRLIRMVAKIKDDGEQKPYDRAEGVFYESDLL
jgi:hypothetical protein